MQLSLLVVVQGVTTALEIEIHFVTSQTVVAMAGVACGAAACDGGGGGGGGRCCVGIETTTKLRLFIAQWVLPLKLFVHHNRFRWIHQDWLAACLSV